MSDLIRDARVKLNLSQRDVAKKLKVAPSAVAQWENGSTFPSMSRRADLARLLDISFQKLIPEIQANASVLIEDAELWQLVLRLQKLLPETREALLMAVAMTEERLAKNKPAS